MNIQTMNTLLDLLKNNPWILNKEDIILLHKYLTFVETQLNAANNERIARVKKLLQTEWLVDEDEDEGELK